MKAITLWQPWASLLACGAKKYETRSWATNYRGPIAIHAAAKSITNIYKEIFPCSDYEFHPSYFAKKQFCDAIKACGLNENEMPTGYIVATAELVGCWEIALDLAGPFICRPYMADENEFDHIVTGNEILFGDWTPGRYAWEFKNMTILPEPIPAKGMQRLWNWESKAHES